MTKPAPTPPQDEPVTVKPPTKFNRRHILMLVATFIAVFAGALLVISLLGGSSPSHRAVSSGGESKSKLAPTSELKVGDYRYMSPCQVLPPNAVTKVMGKMSVDGYILEDSLATNYTAQSGPARTKCEYSFNRESDLSVYLSADQYTDGSELKRLRTLFLSSPDELQQQIAAYKQVADQGKNKDAQAYVTKLEKSLDTYQKHAAVTDPEELSKLNPNGVALPGYLDPVAYIYDNVFYTINVPAYDPKNLTAQQMAKLNGLLIGVEKNVRNKRLDQSPAPTYLNSTTKIGRTKLLEPCTILTTGNFATIAGVAENDLLTRLTLRAQPGKELRRADNSLILPTNSCERTARTGDRSTTSVELQITYASTADGAQGEYAKFNNNGSAEAALQTSADEAKVVGSSYIFRVGPYFANVRISNLTSGNTTNGSQDQHIQAVNILAERLKTANR